VEGCKKDEMPGDYDGCRCIPFFFLQLSYYFVTWYFDPQFSLVLLYVLQHAYRDGRLEDVLLHDDDRSTTTANLRFVFCILTAFYVLNEKCLGSCYCYSIWFAMQHVSINNLFDIKSFLLTRLSYLLCLASCKYEVLVFVNFAALPY
jgi:hypothetical protein